MTNVFRASLPMLLALLASCGGPHPEVTAPAQRPAMAVTTARAELHTVPSVEVLPGTVRSASAVTLAARVAGTVVRLAAEPGARVAAGTVLVELDAGELLARRDQAAAAAAAAEAAIAQAKAGESEAQAMQRLADTEVNRAKQLRSSNATTQADYDAVEARAQAAAARVAVAQAQVSVALQHRAATAAVAAEAAVMVGYTRILAPFDAVVVRRHVAQGDVLAPGQAVMDVENPLALRLEVEVPESLAQDVARQAVLAVTVPAATVAAQATISEITPAADPVSRSVLMKLALPAAPGLHSGQFGRITIPLASGPVLTVPASAVVHQGQLDGVFVVAGDRARWRLVRLGGSAADAVAIRAGLTAGEVVVTAPGDLHDGQAITTR